MELLCQLVTAGKGVQTLGWCTSDHPVAAPRLLAKRLGCRERVCNPALFLEKIQKHQLFGLVITRLRFTFTLYTCAVSTLQVYDAFILYKFTEGLG